jgi:hypothetical protein
VTVETEGLQVVNLHHQWAEAPVFELSIGQSKFVFDMYYDHMIMRGDFTNLNLYDLTGYPKTYDPEIYKLDPKKAVSIDNVSNLPKSEIIGIHKSADNEQGSLVIFELELYYPGCILIEPEKDSDLRLMVEGVKIVYI